jgi:hypothetical protein
VQDVELMPLFLCIWHSAFALTFNVCIWHSAFAFDI